MNAIDFEKLKADLQKHVVHLSDTIGPRNFSQLDKLAAVQQYIQEILPDLQPDLQTYEISDTPYTNIIYRLPKNQSNDRLPLIIGAHYDTVADSPGADDNSSAVAVLMEIALILSKIDTLPIPMELVFFTLEEPPFFYTKEMGSMVYAKSLQKKKQDIEGMICLEMLGYYSDIKNSQNYPSNLMRFIFPDTGNFLAMISNFSSRNFMEKIKTKIQANLTIPMESLNTYNLPVPGIDLSDHSSFWQHGYKAVMITDTAFFRNPNYHKPSDTPETINYSKLAQITSALAQAIVLWNL